MMPKLAAVLVIGTLFLPALAPVALAQHHGEGGPRGGGGWHGGDIHGFHDHDFGVWTGGRWFHGPHFGRDGWWWRAGGAWYWYPAPVYPYPDPYLPPAVTAPPSGQYWYYCPNPQGYYPYVTACPTPWQPVPAQ
jgi:hypothetical protein